MKEIEELIREFKRKYPSISVSRSMMVKFFESNLDADAFFNYLVKQGLVSERELARIKH